MPRPFSAVLVVMACSSEAPPPAAQKPPAAEQAPVAAPEAPPPKPAFLPAPAGTVLLESPPLYVQRCAPEEPCKQMLQREGAAHCEALGLGGMTWRLPEREEAKRFWSADTLADRETFHWTRTPYAEDSSQVWISDPKTKQETTLPKTRRPFVVRCVSAPADAG